MTTTTATTGLDRIRAQQQHARDIGFTPAHDRTHGPDVLVQAALAYGEEALARMADSVPLTAREAGWPFTDAWRPCDDPLDTLAKVGQFVADAMDVMLAERAE